MPTERRKVRDVYKDNGLWLNDINLGPVGCMWCCVYGVLLTIELSNLMWNTFLFFYNSSLLRKRKQNNKIKYLTSHLQGRGALYSMHYKS